MTMPAPMCLWCVHLKEGGYDRCKVFPNGIPDAIWDGDWDHRQPFEGDSGITFEKDPERTPVPWPRWGFKPE